MNWKNSLAITTIAITALASKANAGPTWAQTYGMKSINSDGTVAPDVFYGPGYDRAFSIAKMPDGGVVVAGQLDLPELGSGHAGENADAALVRYAPGGGILWQELIRPSGATSHVYQIATDASGNIFVAGGTGGDIDGAGGAAFVAKFNSGGAIVWSTSVPSLWTFATIGLTADGGIVAGGERFFYNGSSYQHAASIAKFNSDGSGAFAASYNGGGHANAVCQSTDGKQYVILVPSPIDCAPYCPGPNGMAAVLIDSVGEIVAQVNYPPNQSGQAYQVGTEWPIQVIATPDGGYVTLSILHTDGYGNGGGGMIVRKLKANLTEQFEKVYLREAPGGYGQFRPANISLTSDGGYLVFGATVTDNTAPSGLDAALVKLGSDGALQFVSALGGSKDEAGAGGGTCGLCSGSVGAGVPLADGYAFITNTHSYAAEPSSGKADWWIVKTDANRHVENFGDVMAEVPLSLFVVTDNTRAPVVITDFKRQNDYQPTTSVAPFALDNLNTKTGVNKPTILIQARPAPAPPAHGGLSATSFLINGSGEPAYPPQIGGSTTVAGLADSVLRFTVQQTGIPAGLAVRVQATTTPDVESSWTDLNNSRGGAMTYDVARNQFVLNSTDYPTQNNVYFRAIGAAPSYPDSISNVIGPFDLTSSKPHLPATKLLVLANGMAADLYFEATVASARSGVALRVQASSNPTDEGSWADISNGAMTQSTRPNDYLLLVNNYPPATRVFFRAIASLSGYVDSLSQPVGAFNLTSDVPPKVTMIPPNNSLPGSADGSSADKPILLRTGFFSFGASVQTAQPVKVLALGIDGTVLRSFENGETSGSVVTANVVGDHVLEGFAVDKLGGMRRSDAGLLYIRIVPEGSSSQTTVNGKAIAAASTGRTFRVATENGVWTDPTTWDQHDVPGPDDFVIIGSSTIRFGLDGDAKFVTINGGRLAGGAALNIYGQLTITAATIEGPMTLRIKEGAVGELLNQSNIVFKPDGSGFKGNIIVLGTCNVHGAGGITGTDQFVNLGTVNWQKPLTPPLAAATDPLALVRMIDAKSPQNSGKITGDLHCLITSDGAGLISSDGAGLISSDGAGLIGHDGASVISNDGGSIISHDGGTIIGDDGSGLITSDGASLLSERGNGLIGHDGASVLSTYGNGFRRARQSAAEKLSVAAASSAGFVQTGGVIDLSRTMIIGPAMINGGMVVGSGIIAGDVTNNAYISPGHSAGGITIIGNYTQTAQGTLIIENGGATPDKYDRLQVNGAATLNGKLDVRNINGYTPGTQDTFNPIAFRSASGSLTSVSSNATVKVTATGVQVSVDAAKPNPGTGQPLNISTRMKVLTGDNVLIGGFIVYDPTGANASKKVIIRALGPSLPVNGQLADPLLILHGAPGGDVTNDNWQSGDTSQIPQGFAPSNAKESVVVATLPPGAYTAEVKGAHSETGIGLVEVYDLNSASSAKLANISTRGFVDSGDNVMIAGLIVGGQDANNPFSGEPGNVLVRGLGPSLGVNGSLSATVLELHDGNGAVISNQGWRATQESDIVGTTIPPSNDKDSAILATLVPGAYTAIMRGANNTTGIGLIEAYNLQ